jgi:hypothetical protein
MRVKVHTTKIAFCVIFWCFPFALTVSCIVRWPRIPLPIAQEVQRQCTRSYGFQRSWQMSVCHAAAFTFASRRELSQACVFGCKGRWVARIGCPGVASPTGRTESQDRMSDSPIGDGGPGRLITCRVDELRPHPGYLRARITVPASRLSPLTGPDNPLFREPLHITRERTILDGYARWDLAQRMAVPTLSCIEYDLSEEEALLWIIRKHQRSDGLNAFCRVLWLWDWSLGSKRKDGKTSSWVDRRRASQI